jgi:hypothetical protein
MKIFSAVYLEVLGTLLGKCLDLSSKLKNQPETSRDAKPSTVRPTLLFVPKFSHKKLLNP